MLFSGQSCEFEENENTQMGSEKLAIIYIHRMLLAIKSHTRAEDDNSRHPSPTNMHAVKYLQSMHCIHSYIVLHAK